VPAKVALKSVERQRVRIIVGENQVTIWKISYRWKGRKTWNEFVKFDMKRPD